MSGGSRGFTLIELVVAVAVFAVVSAMAYSGLQAVVAGRERVAEETAALGELQTAFTLLARDLRSIVARGYRDRLGDRRPPLHIEDGRLMLVRGGYPNPMGLPRSGLRRVAYGVEDGALTRFSYTAVDSGYDPQAQASRLLDGAEELSFYFLTDDTWAQRWPPAGAAVTSTALPRAVAIRLVHPRYGELERVFLLPGTG
ncbi:type II secretion system minor pseudopilin GspJ [Arhodomonas sp. SL1]|uniref:type II secretion system minor pseudopilin GspJ n=1 Tax=Arhodomonas sp. SL1 TaxID=3425691 RepID=UPI003F880A24